MDDVIHRVLHRCVDHDCEACEREAEARDLEASFPEEYDDPGGQNQYERHLDRMGGEDR